MVKKFDSSSPVRDIIVFLLVVCALVTFFILVKFPPKSYVVTIARLLPKPIASAVILIAPVFPVAYYALAEGSGAFLFLLGASFVEMALLFPSALREPALASNNYFLVWAGAWSLAWCYFFLSKRRKS